MIERLRQSVGAVAQADSTPHALHAPGIVLDEVLHGVLECSTLEPLFEDELLFEAFEGLADERNCSEAAWAESFWHAMASADFAVTARGFLSRHLQRLAPYIPTDVGVSWLQGAAPVENAFALLPLRVIRAWLDGRDVGTRAMPPEVVAQLPEDWPSNSSSSSSPPTKALFPSSGSVTQSESWQEFIVFAS